MGAGRDVEVFRCFFTDCFFLVVTVEFLCVPFKWLVVVVVEVVYLSFYVGAADVDGRRNVDIGMTSQFLLETCRPALLCTTNKKRG